MNKRILWIAGVCIIIGIAAVLFVMMQPHSSEPIPIDAKDITVTDIRRVNVDKSINSYLVWVPGQKNSVAAIDEGFSTSDKIYAYDLETGATSELYDLENYGLDRGNSPGFFWSADGRYIVTGSGGVIDLGKKAGHWIKLPEGYNHLNVEVISPDGKNLFVDGGGDEVFGSFIVNMDSGEFHPFTVNLVAFSPPLLPAPWELAFYPLAWSQDGDWFAVEIYDPDHPPKSFIDVVPSAIYLLSMDGKRTRLIARNIEGRVDSVSFSPDGSKLTWAEARKDEQYIYIANVDGSGAHEIFSNANLPSEYNIPTTSNLLWSPDGTRIVFAGPPDANFKYHLWVLTLGKALPITPTP